MQDKSRARKGVVPVMSAKTVSVVKEMKPVVPHSPLQISIESWLDLVLKEFKQFKNR